MLAAMFSGRHTVYKDPEKGYVFVDRDGMHFRHILNWLTDGVAPISNLSDLECSELLREAEYYQLLVRASLNSASLINANLQDACLIKCSFNRVDLQLAHLQAADLTGAYLEGANLEVAHLEVAHLEGANLKVY
ncbi:putative chromatin remodeling & transcription regulator BTB-POZ family [Helianthus annuus]|nr:putative chromatin remodeling & transcription regulator BTB-POZ family [Helianthus annuus]KAJ0460597.1 putative chromatin remodeling & transcription regulator BTB-POZ family [Helianthus annuus]